MDNGNNRPPAPPLPAKRAAAAAAAAAARRGEFRARKNGISEEMKITPDGLSSSSRLHQQQHY